MFCGRCPRVSLRDIVGVGVLRIEVEMAGSAIPIGKEDPCSTHTSLLMSENSSCTPFPSLRRRPTASFSRVFISTVIPTLEAHHIDPDPFAKRLPDFIHLKMLSSQGIQTSRLSIRAPDQTVHQSRPSVLPFNFSKLFPAYRSTPFIGKCPVSWWAGVLIPRLPIIRHTKLLACLSQLMMYWIRTTI